VARTCESLPKSWTLTPGTPPSPGANTPSPLLSSQALAPIEYLVTRPAFRVRFSKSMDAAFTPITGTRFGAPWASAKNGVSPVAGSGSESSAGSVPAARPVNTW
jgi:hypothetical protein